MLFLSFFILWKSLYNWTYLFLEYLLEFACIALWTWSFLREVFSLLPQGFYVGLFLTVIVLCIASLPFLFFTWYISLVVCLLYHSFQRIKFWLCLPSLLYFLLLSLIYYFSSIFFRARLLFFCNIYWKYRSLICSFSSFSIQAFLTRYVSISHKLCYAVFLLLFSPNRCWNDRTHGMKSEYKFIYLLHCSFKFTLRASFSPYPC